MKLLVLCPRFPYPLEKGDKLRIYHQLRYLGKQHEVFLIALTDEEVPNQDLEKIEELVSEVKIFKLRKRRRTWSLIKCALTNTPFQVAYYYNKNIHQQIKEIAHQFQPDHVYCQLTRMSEYARDLPFPKTLDYMDAFGVGMERRAEVMTGLISLIYKIEGRRMKRYETMIYRFFDHHTVISDQDKRQIGKSDNKIKIIRNGIDTTYFSRMVMEKSHDIGFVGNMGYPPNIDAAEYLIQVLKPKLDSKLSYLIAGARPDKRVKLLVSENVTVTGWIDDVRKAYASCRIFVAPLWSGTGQQNKILEAMAMGVPCITTASVNNAIGAERGKEIMVAESHEDFAACIDVLLNDQAFYASIKENALMFVQENYSWSSSVDLLTELFEQKKSS